MSKKIFTSSSNDAPELEADKMAIGARICCLPRFCQKFEISQIIACQRLARFSSGLAWALRLGLVAQRRPRNQLWTDNVTTNPNSVGFFFTGNE